MIMASKIGESVMIEMALMVSGTLNLGKVMFNASVMKYLTLLAPKVRDLQYR